MYCIGTGDFLFVRFYSKKECVFTMLVDCGACRPNTPRFTVAVDSFINSLPNNILDLLVITHEHNDHVNGFAICYNLFQKIIIREAWFAWTEDPDESTGAARELKTNIGTIKHGLHHALHTIRERETKMRKDKGAGPLSAKIGNFLMALTDLADINLSEDVNYNLSGENQDRGLRGMHQAKILLFGRNVKVRYLYPGEIVTLPQVPGVRFNVLGPPTRRENIFRNGQQGVDVFEKTFALKNDPMLANTFIEFNRVNRIFDLPFSDHYYADPLVHNGMEYLRYLDQSNAWRSIDNDWLNSAGALALRLNSHINNTSLVLAIESEETKKVLLFPGDAEYGSWQSWHSLEHPTGKSGSSRSWAADLLNRTVFYKVSHHGSYNGTALAKGISMMEHPDLIAFVTLDLQNIFPGWKRTMPSRRLLEELNRRAQGRVIFMNDHDINNTFYFRQDVKLPGLQTAVHNKQPLYKEVAISNF